jgi:hypothetical protein
MTTTIDKKKYLELMDTADISPKVIETEDEYDCFLAVAEKLMHKRIDRTPEDTALLMLVVKLIEDYESIHHNLDDWEKSTIWRTSTSDGGQTPPCITSRRDAVQREYRPPWRRASRSS